MARVDELLAGMLAHERRTQELVTSLLGEVSEDSSDEEDEVEEMWIVQDLLTSVCALEARLCEVEARLDEAESAEQQQQQSVGAARVVLCDIESSRIEIGVAMAAAAEAMTFARAVTAELTAAAAVVWWGDSEEKVVVTKGVAWHGDWMREWEAMVRWCGCGWWRRLLSIE